MSAVSAKPLSPRRLRNFIESLPSDRKAASIERQLRLLPRWIEEEHARAHPSEKVIFMVVVAVLPILLVW